MLILVGTVPTAYALNRAVTPRATQDFVAVSTVAADALAKYAAPGVSAPADARAAVTAYVRTREADADHDSRRCATMMRDIGHDSAALTSSRTCRRGDRATSATTCTW